MRFIHTADWHLGRSLYGARLIDDQAHILEQICNHIKETKSSLLVIAGDVYDRSIPAPEAIELLDNFLSGVVLDLKVPVILIAGNHDSARRIEFGSRLLREKGLHIFGSITDTIESVIIEDSEGPVCFYAVPYLEPLLMRQNSNTKEPPKQADALNKHLGKIRSAHPAGQRSVIIAHAFVAGGTTSESERPLSVGGTEGIPSTCFEGFDYVALGHLHRPQFVQKPRIRYAGSPLKYSFSETDHCKSVDLVELNSSRSVTVTPLPLQPRREVRRVEGLFDDILRNHTLQGVAREDYLMVTLLDDKPILDVMERLREKFPNVLHVERPALTKTTNPTSNRVRPDPRERNALKLFKAFFEHVTGNNLSEEFAKAYEEIATHVREDPEA